MRVVKKTKMTGLDCAVLCNLINIHTHTQRGPPRERDRNSSSRSGSRRTGGRGAGGRGGGVGGAWGRG